MIGERVFSNNSSAMPDEFREVLAEMYADELIELAQRFGEKAATWRVTDRPSVDSLSPNSTPLT